MNRENWVDYAKAIGIILVVYGHVARGVVNAGVEVSESTYLLIDSILYSFHMPLFFFLSGLFFVSSFQKRGAVGLVFSKIDTIVYPYLLWSLLQGTIEVYLSNYTNGSVSFSEVFSLLWSPRAHFWFLFALWRQKPYYATGKNMERKRVNTYKFIQNNSYAATGQNMHEINCHRRHTDAAQSWT